MRQMVAIGVTLLKLALALVILALGWMVFSPATTGTWPLAPTLVPAIASAITASTLERGWWGVVVLALGIASVLAALPVKAIARSRLLVAPETLAGGFDRPPTIETVDAGPDSPEPPLHHHLEPIIERHEHTEPAQEEASSHDIDVSEARSALAAHPNAETRSHLADLLKKTGDIEEAAGRLGAAIDAYEESLVLRKRVIAEQPDDVRELRWLWMTLETLADCRDDRGHRTQAAALYREGLFVGERALALAPSNDQYTHDLTATRARLAELEMQTSA